MTAAARAAGGEALNQTLLSEIDPDGVLTEPERNRRVDEARTAYFARLALRSVAARRRAKEALADAEAAEAEAAAYATGP